MRWYWNIAIVLSVVPASIVEAGWPLSAEGPRRGTPEWYEAHAFDPIGQRQRYKFGKVWPARPRPIGEQVPIAHRVHHNFYWPDPYTQMDRGALHQIMGMQVAGGWREATTLYDYHFDEDTQTLNSAGLDHLYWIMSNVPMEFRAAYVQASPLDPQIGNLRLANVQAEAARFVGVEQTPPVLLRVTRAVGSPAMEVDAVFQYRRSNLSPAPVLSGSGGGGGGGGGTQ